MEHCMYVWRTFGPNMKFVTSILHPSSRVLTLSHCIWAESQNMRRQPAQSMQSRASLQPPQSETYVLQRASRSIHDVPNSGWQNANAQSLHGGETATRKSTYTLASTNTQHATTASSTTAKVGQRIWSSQQYHQFIAEHRSQTSMVAQGPSMVSNPGIGQCVTATESLIFPPSLLS
jgi:hypothetical protein